MWSIGLRPPGSPAPICDADWLAGGIWGRDDNLVFVGTFGGISQVAASGGTPRFITRVDPQKDEQVVRSWDLLPGGKALLVTVTSRELDSWNDARIAVQSLQNGERKILIEGGYSARYSPSAILSMRARGHCSQCRLTTPILLPSMLEESHGIRYLVLELVPGETLAERLRRGPLEVSEAIAGLKRC